MIRSEIQPEPSTWTLRCRAFRATIVLFADPKWTVAHLRHRLFAVLKQTYPDGIGSKPLPASADELVLAKPNSKFEAPLQLERLGAEFGTGAESLGALGVQDEDCIAFMWQLDGPVNPASWGIDYPSLSYADRGPSAGNPQ